MRAAWATAATTAGRRRRSSPHGELTIAPSALSSFCALFSTPYPLLFKGLTVCARSNERGLACTVLSYGVTGCFFHELFYLSFVAMIDQIPFFAYYSYKSYHSYPYFLSMAKASAKKTLYMDQLIGSSVVGERGQIVIPKTIRDRLRLRAGAKVLFMQQGDHPIMVIPIEHMQEMLKQLSAKMADILKNQ